MIYGEVCWPHPAFGLKDCLLASAGASVLMNSKLSQLAVKHAVAGELFGKRSLDSTVSRDCCMQQGKQSDLHPYPTAEPPEL